MSMLDKYLKKIGVRSYTDLNAEERETYKEWEASLAGRKLTDEDVAAFFAAELEDTIEKLPKQRLGSPDDVFLKVKLEFIRNAQRFLDRPRIEKQNTEAAIARQIEALP